MRMKTIKAIREIKYKIHKYMRCMNEYKCNVIMYANNAYVNKYTHTHTRGDNKHAWSSGFC